MKKGIRTLLWANIKHKKGAFRSIIILMMLVTISYTVIVSIHENIKDELRLAQKEADVGDYLITIEEEKFTEKMRISLAENEHVERFRTDDLVNVKLPYQVNQKLGGSSSRLRGFSERDRVLDDSMKTVKKQPEAPGKGEVYLSYSLAQIYKAAIGSSLTIQTPNGEENFIIKGFTEDPIYGTTLLLPEFFIISEEDFERLREEIAQSGGNQYLEMVEMVHIFKKGVIGDAALTKELDEQCAIMSNAKLFISKAEIQQLFTLYSGVALKILVIFAVLLLVIALIIMFNSISSSIALSYVDLGILRSQGFTKNQIRRVYLFQYLLANAIGLLLGLLGSVPLISLLQGIFQNLSGIAACTHLSFFWCFAIAAGILLLCFLFVLPVTGKIGKISPVRALNGGKKDVYFQNRVHFPIRKKFLTTLLSLRQITSGMRAYLGTCFVVALLVFFLMSALALSKGIKSETLFGLAKGDITMHAVREISLEKSEEITSFVKETDPEAIVLFDSFVDIYIDDCQMNVLVYSDLENALRVYKGRTPKYENEIAVTEISGEKLNKTIGDKVRISLGGESAEYLITGIFQTTYSSGSIFAMSFESAKRFGVTPEDANLYLSEKTDLTALSENLKEEYSELVNVQVAELTDDEKNNVEQTDLLLLILTVLIFTTSGIFSAVIVSMQCKRCFLRERTDLGILKATGFPVSALRKQFALRFLLLSFFGSVFGVLLALLFTTPILSRLMRIVGLVNFRTEFTPLLIFLPIVVICGCFTIFAAVASRKIKQIQVRELISE